MAVGKSVLRPCALRRLPLLFTVSGAILIQSTAAFGSIITTVNTIVVTGTVTQTVETRTATGQITITPPGGPPMTQTMPAGGGSIRAVVPGFAFAGATVDLNSQKTSHAWGYVSDSGYTASSSADIHKMKTVTSVTVSQIIQRTTTSLDPNELIGVYFAPGVNANINFGLTVADNTAGTTLFNSVTNFSNTSGNTIHDNTGMLTWTREPGFFEGDQGDLGGLPNEFSNDLWILDPFSLTFDTPINLNAGGTYAENIATTVSSSGTVISGSGVFGVSDSVPEPSTYLMIGLGLISIGGYCCLGKKHS